MPKTITINIKYISHLATLAGCEEESIALSFGTDLSGLIKHLAQRYGSQLAGYFLNPQTDDLWPGMAVILNNRLIATLKEAPLLQDGDEIIFLPGAEGG